MKKLPEPKLLGYKVIKEFDEYEEGTLFETNKETDGITAYVHAPNKDSCAIPEWLCASMPEYFEPVYDFPEIPITPIEDLYLTVGQLKEKIKDLPDSGKVLYQRIEDVYFDKHGWITKKKPCHGFPPQDGLVDEFIDVWGVIKYEGDGNLYLTAHY